MGFVLHSRERLLRYSIYSLRQVNVNHFQKCKPMQKQLLICFGQMWMNAEMNYDDHRWHMCQSLAEVTTIDTHK